MGVDFDFPYYKDITSYSTSELRMLGTLGISIQRSNRICSICVQAKCSLDVFLFSFLQCVFRMIILKFWYDDWILQNKKMTHSVLCHITPTVTTFSESWFLTLTFPVPLTSLTS